MYAVGLGIMCKLEAHFDVCSGVRNGFSVKVVSSTYYMCVCMGECNLVMHSNKKIKPLQQWQNSALVFRQQQLHSMLGIDHLFAILSTI